MYKIMNTIFSMNPRLKDSRTGKVMGKYHRGYAEPATAEQVKNRLTAEDVKEDVRLIQEEGREELKDEGLFTLCPHYSQFKENHRCQACIIPESFTYRTCVDVAEKERVEQAIKKALEVNQDPMSDLEGMVEYIEYSPRKKVHIWLRIPQGKTIEETQRDFCAEIEIPFDASCITPERYINMTGDVVYMSNRWLEPLSEKEIEERREAYLMRGLDVDGRPLQVTSAGQRPQQTELDKPDSPQPTEANARTRFIVKECLKEAELEEKDLNTVGGIHNAVKSMLSVGATQLLTQGELLGVLQELMPQYWQEKNILQLVSDFYQKYTDTSQKMTQFQRRLFARSRKIGCATAPEQKEMKEQAEEMEQNPVYGDRATLTDIYASPVPPMMPKSVPPVLKDILKPVPIVMRPTVSMGVMPALGAYPQKFSVLYTDGQYREPRLNSITVGPQGDGKDSSMRGPLGVILKPMTERSSQARREIRAYNEAYNTKAANKEKPRREDFVHSAVQYIKSDITRARLNQAVDEAQGATLYVYMNELSKMEDLEGRYGMRCRYDIINTADDEDNDFGQDRAGNQSVIADTCLRLNYNANTTVEKVHKLLDHVVHEGPVSRATFNTTPVRPIGAPKLRYGKFDEAYEATLKPYIDNLQAASGKHECKPARRLLERLEKEVTDYIVQTQDKVYERLSRRALVACFRRAIVLYAASGMKWSRSFEGWLRWSLHWDLWIKLNVFGELLHKGEQETETHKRGRRNMLEQLPEEFTLKDAVHVRLLNGMEEAGTANMLSQWKHRRYIDELPDGRYRKVMTNDK